MKKKILVCGGAGFIGHHLAKKLKDDGHFVTVVDIKRKCEFAEDNSYCNLYFQLDLTSQQSWKTIKQYAIKEGVRSEAP